MLCLTILSGQSLLLVSSVVLLQQCRSTEQVRLCGKKLVVAVLKLCENCVHGSGPMFADDDVKRSSTKRHSSMKFIASDDSIHLNNDRSINFPVHSLNGTSLFDKSSGQTENEEKLTKWTDYFTKTDQKRVKRQIADECCLNQCSYSNLKKYCCRLVVGESSASNDVE